MSEPVEQLKRRLSQMAVGRHLSYGTVRARLTLLYGCLFALSGAALMAIAYLLLVNAGFVFSLGGAANTGPASVPPPRGASVSLPTAGLRTHPSPETLAYWRGVARCMRTRGFTGFPDPTDVVPRRSGSFQEVSDRSGAILLYPRSLDMRSAAYVSAADACGVLADNPQQFAHETGARSQVREQLLLQSAIALGAMSLLSLALGWFIAGRALQPLVDAYAAQRQFVANASHELRAPLTRQRALIQVALADPHADQASLREAHERVLVSEERLEQLINGLLTLARGQAGLARREDLDIAVIAAEVLLTYRAEARASGLKVHTALAPAQGQGDRLLLERLLANLIGNAIRHNTARGEVNVATGTRDRAPFLSVTNTGPVVAPEDVQRLLRPFERMGAVRAVTDGGHGLGLSIVRAIADAHGAELRLSPQPAGGLAVEVVLSAPRTRSRPVFGGTWLRRAGQRRALERLSD